MHRPRTFTLTLTLMATMCSVISAQVNNGNNNNNNNNNNFAGIVIDSEGVIATRVVRPLSVAALRKQQETFLEENLSAEIIESVPERALSLRNLEETVREALNDSGQIPETIQFMGGLQRVDKIVFDAKNRDVLIVGPAEGFAPDKNGRLVGVDSGRPPLNLDDLVIALRSAVNGGDVISCSIDPTDENMARLQNYLQTNSTAATTSAVRRRYQNMAQILGNQVVSIWGVPQDSHFAVALVEADYRMKRIAIGKEPAGVRGIRSHLSLLSPQGNSLQRWWFVPFYEPLQTNPDESVFIIKGQRAQLMSQEEISDSSGRRTDAASTRRSTEQFAKAFTEHFQDLADSSPPFAELQNLYDCSLVGTLIAQKRQQVLTDWNMETFLNDDRLPVARYPAPKYVRSEAMTKKAGRVMLGLIGGVEMNVQRVTQQRRAEHSEQVEDFRSPNSTENWYWNK